MVQAAPWVEDKAFFSENASLASSKVDAADLNGDGTIDLVFANGGGFDKGDQNNDLPQQAFFNDGTTMVDVSASVFGGVSLTGRAVKLRDIDRDGDNDIILGTTWEAQSQLFVNDGGGSFSNVTDGNLPQVKASVGDLEVGDVDGDGDLDMVLSNWGPAGALSVATNSGGLTLLWQQMGEQAALNEPTTGMFEDTTFIQMPNMPVRWSWDLEFVDVDNDYDLDIVVSANAGDKASLFLFANDGLGTFKDATAGNIPQGKQGLDVEPMDLNDDGTMDLLSLHDATGGRNRMLLNSGPGKFTVDPGILWQPIENPTSYDLMAAFYDHDSNGVVDFVIGAFQNQFPDRLIYSTSGNKKTPSYKADTTAFEEFKVSGGTFAIVLADFNNDTRLDVAMAQNENAFEKKVLMASEEIPLDTQAPWLSNIEALGALQFPGIAQLRLRCHDNKSPLMLHDFKQTDSNEGFPYIETWTTEPADPDNMPGDRSAPGQWYGEYLWKVQFAVPDTDTMWYRLCAIDAAGNKRCTELTMAPVEGGTTSDTDTGTTTDLSTGGTDTTTGFTTSSSDTSASTTGPESTTSTSDGLPTTTGPDGTPTTTGPDGTSTTTVPTTGSSASDPQGTSSTGESSSDTVDHGDGDPDSCSCTSTSTPSSALFALLVLARRRRRGRVPAARS